ncbi:Geranylgeranyl diphosphate reductase [hydrothermal vent metagenome]|uniref:Geranylgeranyl diphosphate reductase n=1 Tax=hydrothermal vent metagenome TaxID=652676 RepID=A0A3B1CGU1_9ZZZZ
MVMRTQVLVVGGGPAGATAARMLAGAGIEVILVEKDLRHRKVCGGGIASTALEELAIPRKIPHRAVNKIRFVSPSGRKLDIPLEGGEILVVERMAFDSLLRSLAGASGAQVLEGEFSGFQSRDSKLKSRILINGEPGIIESDYLIASDGVNSRVRSSLGLKSPGCVFTLSCSVEGLESDACEFWFGSEHAPSSYSWVFPKVGIDSHVPQALSPSGGWSSVGTGISYGSDARLFFERFLKRLDINGSRGMTVRGYKVPLWKNGIYNAGKILFAGDSATQVMPFTYEGIYYAMKSGEFAAEAIINNRLSLYRKLWRKRFLSRFMLMRTLESVFLRNDAGAEKLFDMFGRADVQEASMRLWLRKDSSRGSLLSYINLFRKFLH